MSRPALLCGVLMTPVFLTAAPVPKAAAPAPPFPMTVGDTREYQYRTGDKVEAAHTDEVTAAELQKDGSTKLTVRRSPARGEAVTIVIAVSAAGIYRVSEGDHTPPQPEMLLKLPADKGVTWDGGGRKHTVLAEEDVTVPAGTYQTAKVELDYGSGKTLLWFAPGVGLVKMDTGKGRPVLELKAFKPGK